jgi:hypothetical protein
MPMRSPTRTDGLRLDHDLGLEVADPIRRARLAGAKLERLIQLVLTWSTATTRTPSCASAVSIAAADPPSRPRHGLPCVGGLRWDGATAGEHREQGGHHRRHVLVDRHDRPAADDGGGERRDTEVMQDRGAVAAGKARPPASSVPAPPAALPSTYGARPSVAHALQSPQRGRNVMTTRCPTARSWRRNAADPFDDPGGLVGRAASALTDPVAVDDGQIVAEARGLMRTACWVSPGGARSRSAMVIGRDSAKLRGAPIRRGRPRCMPSRLRA